MEYRLIFARETVGHFRKLSARDHKAVLDAIQAQLVHEPAEAARHRKRLRPNPVAPWELRVGNLRVYYDVKVDPEPVVEVLAIGVKDRTELRIGGKVVKLEDPGVGSGD
ncbi:MAG: type II toxin-antitoxin system RelE family toxin [Thermoanaerobaculia bacterium]